MWSWGSNKYGQLGFPLTDVAHCLEPKRLPIDGGAAVACGAAHSAVLTGPARRCTAPVCFCRSFLNFERAIAKQIEASC